MAGNESEILRHAIQYMLLNVHTCMPGEIVSYDEDTRKAAVQPCINRVYTDGKVVQLPIVYDCPVQWPSTPRACVTMNLEPGDPGMLHFAERDISGWLQSGGIQNPAVPGNHSLSHAIFVPGLQPGQPGKLGAAGYDLHVATADGAEVILDAGAVIMRTAAGAEINLAGDTIAIGNPTTELLTLIAQALTDIATATTVGDHQALSCAPQLTLLAAQLVALTGSL